MSEIRDEFDKAYLIECGEWVECNDIEILNSSEKTTALWAAKWAMNKCAEACMSPTSKGRIIQLMKELDGE